MKGVANHHGPELCEGGRETAREALTGENAGRLLTSETNEENSRKGKRTC